MSFDFSVEIEDLTKYDREVEVYGGHTAQMPVWNPKTDKDGRMSYRYMSTYVREYVASVAKTVLRVEQDKNTFPKRYTRIVDGSYVKEENEIRLNGRIVYDTKAKLGFGGALVKTYIGLLKLSKQVTGTYASSHVVFHKGVMIAKSLKELESWVEKKAADVVKTGDIIRIVNMMPYARRLEYFGLRSKGTFTRTRKDKKRGRIRRPNGVYHAGLRRAKTAFKGSAAVKRSVEFIPGNEIGLTTSPFKSRPGGGQFRTHFKSDSRPYLYPSIVIVVIGD